MNNRPLDPVAKSTKWITPTHVTQHGATKFPNTASERVEEPVEPLDVPAIPVDEAPIISAYFRASLESGLKHTINLLDLLSGGKADTDSFRLTEANGDRTFVYESIGIWQVVGTDLVFTPEGQYEGKVPAVHLTVLSDKGVRSDSAIVSLDYADAVARPPTLYAKDITGLTYGQAVFIPMLEDAKAGDQTIDANSVRFVNGSSNGHIVGLAEGEWTVNAVGVIKFTPKLGTVTAIPPVQVIVSDINGIKSSPVTVSVTYLADQVPPTLPNEVTATMDKGVEFGGNALIHVTVGSYAIDPSSLQFVGTSAPGESLVIPHIGAWTIPSVGIISFKPEEGFTGHVPVTRVVVSDIKGNKSNASAIYLEYEAVLQTAPVVRDFVDSGLVSGAAYSMPVLARASKGSLDLDPYSITIVGSGGAGDSFTVPNEGIYTVNTTTGSITATPNATSVNAGTATAIYYTIADIEGNISNQGRIQLTYLAAANHPPVAGDVSITNQPVGQVISIPMADVVTDPEGAEDLEPSSFRFSGTSSALAPLVVGGIGVWSVDLTTASVLFTPDSAVGTSPVPPANYTIKDKSGNTSNVGIITVGYASSTNVPPVVQDVVLNNAPFGDVVSVSLASSVSDSDGYVNPNSLSIGGKPEGQAHTTAYGTYVPKGNQGLVEFYPVAGLEGTVPSVSYTVKDDKGTISNVGHITLNILPKTDANQPPFVQTLVYNDLPAGQSVATNVLYFASDADSAIDSTTLNIIGSAGEGQPLNVPDIGVWSIGTDGVIAFTPDVNLGDTQVPTIQYTVRDVHGLLSNVASITISYSNSGTGTGTGTGPVIFDRLSQDNAINSSIGVNVLNDAVVANGKTLDMSTLRISGTAAPLESLTTNQGQWTVSAVGIIYFVPNAGMTGAITPITYTVKDSAGDVSNVATFTLTYATDTTGNPPTATNLTLLGQTPDTPVVFNMQTAFTDSDGTLMPNTAKFVGAVNALDPFHITDVGTWSIQPAAATVTFTPVAGNSPADAYIQLTVEDNDGNVSQPSVLHVGYTQSSTAPTMQNANLSTTMGNSLQGDMRTLTTDPSGSFNPIGWRLGDGSLSKVVAGVGTWSIGSTGWGLTFTPEAAYVGTAVIEVVYTDSAGASSNAATISVAVTGSGTGTPTVADASGVGVYDTASTYDVANVTTDPTGGLNPTGWAFADGNPYFTDTGRGLWEFSGSNLTFTPESGFSGSASAQVVYTSTSGVASAAATYTLVINAPSGNIPPVANDVTRTGVAQGSTTTIDMTVEVSDSDGVVDSTTAQFTGTYVPRLPVNATEGVWSFVGTDIKFVPEAGFVGTATIGYFIKDNLGATSNVGTISITVDGTSNVAPVISDASLNNLAQGAQSNIDLTPLISDANDQAQANTTRLHKNGTTYAPLNSVNVAGEGTWSFSGASLVFTPVSSFLGTATIGVTIEDSFGAESNEATISFTYVSGGNTVNATKLGLNTNWSQTWDAPAHYANSAKGMKLWVHPAGTTTIVQKHGTLISASSSTSHIRAEVFYNEVPQGTYTVNHAGSGNAQIAIGTRTDKTAFLSWGVGQRTLTIPAGASALYVWFKGSSLSSLELVHSTNAVRFAQGKVFSQAWLDFIAASGSKLVRTMNLQQINNNRSEDALDIPAGTAISWFEGLPPIGVCALASEANVDVHCNIPPRANNQGILGFAQVLKANFPSNHEVFIEYGNELWNYAGDFYAGLKWVHHLNTPKSIVQSNPNGEFTWNAHGLSNGDLVSFFETPDTFHKYPMPEQNEYHYLLRYGNDIRVVVVDGNTIRLETNPDAPGVPVPVIANVATSFYGMRSGNVINPNLGITKTKQVMDLVMSIGLSANMHTMLAWQNGLGNDMQYSLDSVGNPQFEYIASAPYFQALSAHAKVEVDGTNVIISVWRGDVITGGDITCYLASYPTGIDNVHLEKIKSGYNAEDTYSATLNPSNDYTVIATVPLASLSGAKDVYVAFSGVPELSPIIKLFVDPNAGPSVNYFGENFNSRMLRDVISVASQMTRCGEFANVIRGAGSRYMTYEGGWGETYKSPLTYVEYLRDYHLDANSGNPLGIWVQALGNIQAEYATFYKETHTVNGTNDSKASFFGICDDYMNPTTDAKFNIWSAFNGEVTPKQAPVFTPTQLTVPAAPSPTTVLRDFATETVPGVGVPQFYLVSEHEGGLSLSSDGKLTMPDSSNYNFTSGETLVIHVVVANENDFSATGGAVAVVIG